MIRLEKLRMDNVDVTFDGIVVFVRAIELQQDAATALLTFVCLLMMILQTTTTTSATMKLLLPRR
jgi:hypothetical protein